MMPRAGTMHISTRMEFCVAKDCTAFGTYPVNSNTNPIAKAVKLRSVLRLMSEGRIRHLHF